MSKKHILNILVVTFTVMIVLFRPFFVYHLSTQPGFPKEPNKVARLLQSLIKKKNDHAAETEEIIEISAKKKQLPPPAVFSLLFNKTLWLLSLLFGLFFVLDRGTVFHVSPSTRYCRFLCRFQI
jgi:hypothetical protein